MEGRSKSVADPPAPPGRCAPSAPVTVLIVEDEPSIRRLLRCFLERDGYAVVEAADGLAALHLLAEHRPQLVVTDMRMPVMNGRRLIAALRADPLTAPIPILLLSAESDGAEPGVDAAIVKPFGREALLDSVRSLTRSAAP